ncbi:7,8-dihydro-8-oxoguanine triphosphatase OS=Homo sapiens GN=NUDT1 PE=1 SV=3 [Rhizoctonia solani AG-1 IB]|uniref:Oxidized purine nucleoside triphosphate hydrolase n=1 Tax=Thanatephorus cucumeris (strain AG1-IB / isolate 7/3/14) TaxID=1108050 RepID=A0A0B7FAK6_THACB|nr:7,8-dihydro-8-oxoguanine triphosphatase OS=Homo sapiens GN=NUDT1 PE=1 SV=3 [Rhizoctonia solani AG-1 IB]
MHIPGIPPLPSLAITSEGSEQGYHAWRQVTAVKRFTNAFVFDPEENKILLGLKKRGFGVGIYNGFGGKLDAGETIADAALRELREESNLSASLEPCGLLFFVGAGHAHAHHITVFRAHTWQGQPTETDEMRPEWFAYPSLEIPSTSVPSDTLAPFPYSAMWKDDPLWVPHLLTGKYFVARVDYGPVPVPEEGQSVDPVSDGTGYIVDGTTVEAGMQKWVVGTMDKDEWEKSRVWEV